MERFLMKVLDKSWHVQCVKCSECQCLLSEKCFLRDNKLYCRSDFFRFSVFIKDFVRFAFATIVYVYLIQPPVVQPSLEWGRVIRNDP